MGRLGTFVPRLVALTAVWLLATTALTYAAAQRISTPATAAAPAATAAAAPAVLVVPDVRRQAYVFAEGTLGDAGFAWRVTGSVHGYASNTVTSQSPTAGTRLIDTGAPTIVLHLSRSGTQAGTPEDASAVSGTAVKSAELALNPVAKTAAPAAAPKPVVRAKPAAKPKVTAKAKTASKPRATAPAKAPKRRAPAKRPPDFLVPDARREPLSEIPLTDRADALLRWIDRNPHPSDANVRYWLYQHSWIVAGARMGWWHGSDALRTLVAVDDKVWDVWGIGAHSGQVARDALTYTEAKSR